MKRDAMKAIKGIRDLPIDASFDVMDTPVGELTIVFSGQGLHAILWDNYRENPACKSIFAQLQQSSSHQFSIEAKKQLSEYFQGKRQEFDLPLVICGTAFQQQAWEQLRKIPYAQTISYGEQAARLGDKNKARAVGMANGLNPLSIIIPCHRVIGASGRLVGFGGGLCKKEMLLNLEKHVCNLDS